MAENYKNGEKILSSLFGGGTQSTGNFDFGELLSGFATSKKGSSKDEDDVDWKHAYLTLKDDFESYRRRTESMKSTEKENLTKEIILGLLEVIDYAIFTYKAKNQMGTYTKEDEMILDKLSSFLGTYGIEPMDNPTGKPFDHNVQEAVVVDSTSSYPSGTVSQLISHGYLIGGKVLRYAKVVVAA